MALLNSNQLIGLRNNSIGLITGLILIYLFYQAMPAIELAEDNTAERLGVAIKALFWGGPLIMVMILKASIMRLLTSSIDGRIVDLDTTLDIDRRVLYNTLEQYILAIPSYCVLSLYLDVSQLHIFNALIATFVIARLIFWVGYHHNPMSRAYGFMMTFLPTCVVTVMAATELLG